MAARLKQIADSQRFQRTILVVIGINAVTLGLQTYDTIDERIGGLLLAIDGICLAIFCAEILIRIGAYGRRPQDFFKSGWNVFDFVVVGAVFLPGVRENVTLLRLVRVFRVLRVVSVMPDLRVLIRGMVSSIAPIASLGLFAVLIMYVYGMVGWALFHEGDPENWATIGDAILTLFVVMTLESWPDIMGSAMEVSSWAWVYFVSYVLVASFLIINVVIAIIISAVEEARDEERHEAAVEAAEAASGNGDVNADFHDPARIRERIADLRLALDELEAETGVVPAAPRNPARSRPMSKAQLRP